MKPIAQVMRQIRESGLIYDPFVTASIISYEAGHLLRNSFYASMVEEGREDEDQLKAGWLANGHVEMSDLLTQCRVLCEIYGWDWDALIDTGEAKLTERIGTYKQRGVRPNEALLKAYMKSQGMAEVPKSKPQPFRYNRSGD